MWKENIQNRLDEIVLKSGLPKDSLMLEANMSKDGKRVTSYSICIFEPDYPPALGAKTKNDIVLNIKTDESRSNSDMLEFLVSNEQIKNVGIPQGAETKSLKSDNMVKHVLLRANDNNLIEFVENNVMYCLEHYTSKNGTFGCCGKFRECSKEGKCLHENLLYAKGCQYRPNMEKGNAYMLDA